MKPKFHFRISYNADTWSHLIPEGELEELVVGLETKDEVVDDDEVEGEEGAAPDVDDLEAGEGEHGQLVHLVRGGDRSLHPSIPRPSPSLDPLYPSPHTLLLPPPLLYPTCDS